MKLAGGEEGKELPESEDPGTPISPAAAVST